MLYVKEFREARGLHGKQIVEVMREKYPKYDKTIHSKVERYLDEKCEKNPRLS